MDVIMDSLEVSEETLRMYGNRSYIEDDDYYQQVK